MSYLKIIHDEKDFTNVPVDVTLDDRCLICSHTLKSMRFPLIESGSILARAIRRWFSMSVGGDIPIRLDEIKFLKSSSGETSIRISPGWPCDCDFEIGMISTEIVEGLEAWGVG